jgi:predicted nucleic acid-binding protein
VANRYLLDTTVLVDASKNREPVRSRVDDLLRGADEVGVSAVNVAEFIAGVRPEDRPKAEEFLDGLVHWDVTREIAVQAGLYRYDYARQGQTPLIPDALIAATARVLDAILLTNNVKDFPMPELTVERLGA